MEIVAKPDALTEPIAPAAKALDIDALIAQLRISLNSPAWSG